MMKVCLLLALTIASVSALQDSAANGGEAAPEPYSYAYQTDSHAASEQRDQQGRVTGFYTLTDADGRERRVEYVADEGGFRARVATNEVGTKAENPANVEMVAAEPTPAQYAAYTQSSSYQAAAAPAVQQGAQYVRQQTYQVAGAPQVAANYATRVGYTNQQYAYRPYGATSYYTSGAAYPAGYSGYGANYNGAYGGYGAAYYAGGVPATTGYYTVTQQQAAPAGYYGYSTNYGPASQYYSYRSSSSGGAAPVAPAGAFSSTGNSAAYRYVSQPAGVVSTTYRQVSTGGPVGVSTYSAGFPVGVQAGVGGVGAGVGAGVASSSSSRSATYGGSSNYLVLKKRDAEAKEQVAAASSN